VSFPKIETEISTEEESSSAGIRRIKAVLE